MRKTSRIAILTVLFTIAACTPSEQQTTDWESPQWMLEQASMREQFVTRLQGCMDSKGWTVTVDESAGILEPFNSEEEMARATKEIDACLNEQGIDPTSFGQGLTEESLATMYEKDIDTYNCLIAHGIDMQNKPPTVEVYIEEGLRSQNGEDTTHSWWPYGDPELSAKSQTEIQQLKESCPERWTFGGN